MKKLFLVALVFFPLFSLAIEIKPKVLTCADKDKLIRIEFFSNKALVDSDKIDILVDMERVEILKDKYLVNGADILKIKSSNGDKLKIYSIYKDITFDFLIDISNYSLTIQWEDDESAVLNCSMPQF